MRYNFFDEMVLKEWDFPLPLLVVTESFLKMLTQLPKDQRICRLLICFVRYANYASGE